MHGHGVLMLAAVGVIGAFVPIVVIVTLLQRRGRLGPPERRLPFATYGPFLAATLTAGAAGVHLGLIVEHAALSLGVGGATAAVAGSAAVGGLAGAAAFVCSVGAGAAHFAGVSGSIGGFLPLGLASLGLAPVHAVWSIPRLWRRAAGAVAGIVVTGIVLAIGVAPLLVGTDASALGSATSPSLGYADVIDIVLEAALALVFALLVLRRPRGLLDRLEVRVADAWVGTGLGVAAVAIFSFVAIVAGHAVH